VGIDQSRNDGASAKIDHPGYRSRHGAYLGCVPQRQDFPIANRQGLTRRKLRIDRQYFSIQQNRVGNLRAQRRGQQRDSKQ